MSRKIEFFYDYVSLYSYLANSQMSQLDAEVVYRPMFLGAVMKSVGNKPPLRVPAKGKYLFKDVARWVDRYSIPFRMNPEFPQNTVNALRLALIAQDEGEFDAVHQALFDAMWVHEKNLSDETVIADIIAAAGMSLEGTIAKLNSDEVKQRLRENTDEAVARGAFGAPTFYVGDEMFFGNDRFDFIRAALKD